ncbi:MAG TPA: hypothetical protein VH643_07700 [Gemmataceae bacterium]|jgi:hypothetical protein
MAITVEYLAIFRRTDSFCNSVASFTRLLQVDSEIRVAGGDIHFQGERACGFQISSGEVTGKKQRYFHLHFTWDGAPDTHHESLERFLALLKKVRGTLMQAEGEVETLRNDLSSHYARKAYPLIHEIENLMRRLIANFMLVTVGREWVKETLPKAVEDAVKASKRKEGDKDYLNVLHTVDFIHLGALLFDPYSKGTPQELFAKLKDAKTADDVKVLQEFVPESNWKRYFAKLVAWEDGQLKSRWEKLYLLRCKVAHNALMTGDDLEEIEKLVGEVKPKLQEAIAKLSKVTVPPEEVELVAESAARTVNATVGEFITCWQQLEAAIANRMEARGKPKRLIHPAQELVRQGILDPSRMERYDEVRQVRNSIVHGPATEVPVDTIQHYVCVIGDLLACVEAGSYIEYLRELSKADLWTEIDSRVADTHHEIADSEVFNSTVAETNATGFAIGEYEVQDIDVGRDECVAKITFRSSGDQLEDRMHCGNVIIGEAEAVFDQEGRMEYRIIIAEVDHGDDGFPPSGTSGPA